MSEKGNSFQVDDSRQSSFNKVSANIGETSEDIKVNRNIDGFPASHVDLGWLHDQIKHDTYLNEWDKEDRIVDFLVENLDRPKGFDITYRPLEFTDDDQYNIKIDFKTKDDYGYYTYGFEVAIFEENQKDSDE